MKTDDALDYFRRQKVNLTIRLLEKEEDDEEDIRRHRPYFFQRSYQENRLTKCLDRLRHLPDRRIMRSLKNIDGVALIGFRTCPDSEKPEFYTFITYGEEEVALSENGYLVFFNSLSDTAKLFQLFGGLVTERFSAPTETNAVCDIALVLNLLENKESDQDGEILYCLNTIFDLFNSIDLQIPEDKKAILYGLADHLTFEKEFASYLEKSSMSRRQIIDLLLWGFGAILSRSKLVT
jgi:hypothetical protein